MTGKPVTWQPKEVALRDLIWLTLYRKGGVIIDSTGHVASRLRESIGIPDSKLNRGYISTVMQKMAQTGMIERRMDDGGRRTYDITVVGTLTAEQVEEYEASEADNKSRFMDDAPASTSEDSTSDLDRLVRECSSAYAALQRMATADSTRVGANGRVAINAAGVISAIGIPRGRIKRIRYYLRLLGLAVAQTQVDSADEHLWWWTVSDKPFNDGRLRQLATGDQSFEARDDRRRGTPKAGPVTVRRADSPAAHPVATPAVLDHKRTVAARQPVVDPLVALTDVAERLAEENTSLHGQLRDQEISHTEEVARLTARIRELEGQLGERQQAERRASELIARYASPTATS